MPDPILEYDTLDEYNWSQRETFYHQDGTVSAIQYVFDNGTLREDLFAPDGLRTSIREEDPSNGPNVFDWFLRETTYDSGQIVGRVTRYDDGNFKYETYTGGLLSQTEITDEQHVEIWHQIVQYFDFGERVATVIDYDDGSVRETLYDNGAVTEVREIDSVANPATHDWETINTYYQPDGSLAARVTVYDNGAETDAIYQNGVISEIAQRDAGDAFGWTTINTYFQTDGALAGRITNYDDGVERIDDYREGALERTSQVDQAGDARGWETYDTYYNPDGTMAGREIAYDDGRLDVTYFTNGIKDRQEVTDRTQSGDPQGQSWETQFTYFESNGDTAFRETRFDNGIVKGETFAGGVLERIEQFDTAEGGGAKSWDSIISYYDWDGALATRETVYDNGIIRTENFDGGIRREVEEVDAQNSKSWDSRTTSYNTQEGYVNGKTTLNDNGIETNLGYDQGVLSVKEQVDSFDISSWDNRLTVYDDTGAIDVVQITQDNQDLRFLSYAADDSGWDIRIDQDVNGSDSWEFKVLDRSSGSNVVTTYGSFEELTATYQDAMTFEYTVTI